jgi:hypothetical protein
MKKIYYAFLASLMTLVSFSSHAQYPYVSQNFTPQSDLVFKIINGRSGQALEIGGGDCQQLTPGANANQWPYYGNANQQWIIRPTPDNDGYSNIYFEIINRASGYALEIGGGAPANTDWGATANIWYSFHSPQQQWSIQYLNYGMGRGGWRIVNRNSGKCLEIGGDNNQNMTAGRTANQWPFYDNDNQLWNIEGRYEKTQTIYGLVNANSGKALEVACGSYNSGARIQQWDRQFVSETSVIPAQQEWYVKNVFGNTYSIISRNSKQVLEIGGDYSTTLQNGAPANQWPDYGNDNQLWERQSMPDGTFVFLNKRSGKALEVAGYSTSNGATVQQWDYTGSSSQRWNLTNYLGSLRGTAPEDAGAVQSTLPTVKSAPSQSALIGGSTLTVFPNPTRAVLNLSLQNLSKDAQVKVLDAKGAVTKAQYQGEGKVDVASLESGLYLIVVSDGGKNYSQKFTKE